MKCKTIFLKLFSLFIFVVLFLCSCCSTKKITTTTTKIKVDTVLTIKYDTVTIYKEVYLTDTVEIVNTTSVARAYYNVSTQKIALELKGVPFNVPFNFDKLVTTKTTVVSKPKCKFLTLIMTFGFGFMVGFIVVAFGIIKKFER